MVWRESCEVSHPCDGRRARPAAHHSANKRRHVAGPLRARFSGPDRRIHAHACPAMARCRCAREAEASPVCEAAASHGCCLDKSHTGSLEIHEWNTRRGCREDAVAILASDGKGGARFPCPSAPGPSVHGPSGASSELDKGPGLTAAVVCWWPAARAHPAASGGSLLNRCASCDVGRARSDHTSVLVRKPQETKRTFEAASVRPAPLQTGSTFHCAAFRHNG